MKDFYSRLKVRPYADESDIRRAIDQTQIELDIREAAEYVLLDQKRRQVYDRTHRVLAVISELRVDLGLEVNSGKLASCYTDFRHRNDFDTAAGLKPANLKDENSSHSAVRYLPYAVMVSVVALWLFMAMRPSRDLSDPTSPQSAPNPIVESVSRSEPVAASNTPKAKESEETASIAEQLYALLTPEKSEPAEHPPLPLPATSATFPLGELNGEAPLEIITRKGSGHYFVLVSEVGTDKCVAKLFIRGGDRLQTEVPLGRYRIAYCSGDRWYGEDELFGSRTQFAEADDTFNFTASGNRVQGFSIELFLQSDGNLHTDPISREEFVKRLMKGDASE